MGRRRAEDDLDAGVPPGTFGPSTLHHTATTNSYSAAEVPKILRSIYHFHAVSRGWGDIGYNVLLDRFGRLWEGRRGGLSRPLVGAHAGGFNSYTTGVSFIGDHRRWRCRPRRWRPPPDSSPGSSRSVRRPTRAARPSSPAAARHRSTRPARRSRCRGSSAHGLTNRTECPGRYGLAVLGRLRQRVARPARPLGEQQHHPAADDHVAACRRELVHPPLDPARASGEPCGDLPVPADYDGDGTTDLATWTPSTGTWAIRYSLARRLVRTVLGSAGDVPVPADTNGDGRAEPMTWTPATGAWHRIGVPDVTYGTFTGDVPVPADYSGDGRADLAVWRPRTATWHMRGLPPFIRRATSGTCRCRRTTTATGDVDPATWSPNTHRFYVRGAAPRDFAAGDVPVPGQYDGDAPLELAVWRAEGARGRWIVEGRGEVIIGTPGSRPIPIS